MNPLLAFAFRFGRRPTDTEMLQRASASTRAAWEEARRKRATAGSA